MEYFLGQRGRSLLDFEVTVRRIATRLQARVESELAAVGIDAETLPEDMDDRHSVIDAAMAGSQTFEARALLGEWCARQHGRAAMEAFTEIEPALAPRLDALATGNTSLTRHCGKLPEYWSSVLFHRTYGGWDAGEYNGFVHGELVHRNYVAKVFPGDIYGNRRGALKALPRSDYRRILEIGTSSGHYTLAIAESFPQAQITGVDPSIRMLEQAQRIGNEQGMAWDLHVGVGEDMPMFADATFDLVTAYAVHHELPTDIIRSMFAEAFRVLSAGGDLIFADVARTSSRDRLSGWRMDWSARWGGEPYWRSSAALDMAPLAREAGFNDVRGWEPEPGRDPYLLYARKPA